MPRTQTRCFFVSAVVHSLLLALLVVSSAFVTRKERIEDKPLIHMFRVENLTDDIVPTPGGGGSPEAAVEPAKPLPAPPEPKPEIKAEPKPEVKVEPIQKDPPPKPPVKRQRHETPPVKPKAAPVNNDPDALKPDKKREKPKVEVDLSAVVKPNTDDIRKRQELRKKEAREREERQREETAAYEAAQRDRDRVIAEANAARDRAQRSAAELKTALHSIQGSMGSGLEISMPGPGAGAYANYSQVIYSIYYDAWQTPEAKNDNAKTRVRIVVARDGSVVSTEILDRSGDGAMDKSIRQLLDRVRKLPAFPEGAKDEKREFRITFSLKAKRFNG